MHGQPWIIPHEFTPYKLYVILNNQSCVPNPDKYQQKGTEDSHKRLKITGLCEDLALYAQLCSIHFKLLLNVHPQTTSKCTFYYVSHNRENLSANVHVKSFLKTKGELHYIFKKITLTPLHEQLQALDNRSLLDLCVRHRKKKIVMYNSYKSQDLSHTNRHT